MDDRWFAVAYTTICSEKSFENKKRVKSCRSRRWQCGLYIHRCFDVTTTSYRLCLLTPFPLFHLLFFIEWIASASLIENLVVCPQLCVLEDGD